MMEIMGAIFAVVGSIVSIFGALSNNILHDHRGAMELWMFSNILLLVWCAGNLAGLWNGGISVSAMMVMYLIFSVSNAWGLFHV